MSEEVAAPEPAPIVHLVAAATALFYLAEHEENPGVRTFWDAFHYISTCVSFGAASVAPVTPLGKLISGVVTMVAPGLLASPPAPPR